ncbi:MAG: UDP-N-acetylmuramate--L-alanine ligase [Candidatus Kapabacteria bacterium]|nr:UDP-N-acetylmuramate--L-alanine ligase [Ignavibacteriota bacterium]MCW5885481.1 UDP-N-acetylmuramate--L-alanine ligase [Candidatus Kapabacteria bacterium]
MFKSVKRIHFVGIGGIGMSAIAEILINQGFEVSGSDLYPSQNTDYLENIGAKIVFGHNKDNISDSQVVVYSSAVNPQDNPETMEALERGIPIVRRAEMLAEVSRLNYCLAVAGTHGKTTTTSMIGLIFIKAGYDPTVIVGGRLADFGGTNARLGQGNWTVVEADEYDRSFLQLLPTISIINNIEPEHLDIYRDFDDIKDTFTEFANKAPFYGLVAVGIDDVGSREILGRINKQITTFGIDDSADYTAKNIITDSRIIVADIYEKGILLGKMEINIPGLHNLKNALGAISVARNLGIPFDKITEALHEFKGVYRRFDIKGEFDGVIVVDDYAHHPTEIKATLSAARNGWTERRIVAAFQPHTFTRTRAMWKEFAESFDDADVVIVSEIYPAREKPIYGITGKMIYDYMLKNADREVYYIPTLEGIDDFNQEFLKAGDLFITIGAGNICNCAEKFLV